MCCPPPGPSRTGGEGRGARGRHLCWAGSWRQLQHSRGPFLGPACSLLPTGRHCRPRHLLGRGVLFPLLSLPRQYLFDYQLVAGQGVWWPCPEWAQLLRPPPPGSLPMDRRGPERWLPARGQGAGARAGQAPVDSTFRFSHSTSVLPVLPPGRSRSCPLPGQAVGPCGMTVPLVQQLPFSDPDTQPGGFILPQEPCEVGTVVGPFVSQERGPNRRCD